MHIYAFILNIFTLSMEIIYTFFYYASANNKYAEKSVKQTEEKAF